MQPAMETYRYHILVCTGGYCSPNRGGRELYAMLPDLLQREGLLFGPDRVKRGETPVLESARADRSSWCIPRASGMAA